MAASDIPTLWQGEQGGHARLLAGTSGPDMVELWQWSLYPGEIFTSPGHGDGTTELLFVTEGALTLTVNDGVYLIRRGIPPWRAPTPRIATLTPGMRSRDSP
jgi:hypothetical protein